MLMGGLTGTLVFELCTQARKFFRVAYVPIYFQFLPLDVLNRDLSLYVGDDFFMGPGGGPKLTRAEAERLKRRLQLLGVFAVAISAIVIPGVAAFGVAQIIAPNGVWPSIIGIACLQLYRTRLAMIGFGFHASVADKRTTRLLLAVYLVYTVTVLWVFHTVYWWVRPYVESGNYANMFRDIMAIVIGKVVVAGLVLALVAAVFLKFLTERPVPSIDDLHDDDPKSPR